MCIWRESIEKREVQKCGRRKCHLEGWRILSLEPTDNASESSNQVRVMVTSVILVVIFFLLMSS